MSAIDHNQKIRDDLERTADDRKMLRVMFDRLHVSTLHGLSHFAPPYIIDDALAFDGKKYRIEFRIIHDEDCVP